MGGLGYEIWLTDDVDLAEILPGLGWNGTDKGFERSGREYWACVTPPRPVYAEDIPDAIDQLLPGISVLVEVYSEGRPKAAERLLSRTANAIARVGHGVISDGHEAWIPSGVRRAVGISHEEEGKPQLLVMSWWAAGGPLSTREGITQLISTLQRFLPEAMPDRWDDKEPPSHRSSVEGAEGLIDFLDEHRLAGQLAFLWPKRPVYDLSLNIAWWGGPFPYFNALFCRIGIDAHLILQPGWPRQLPRAFREISRVIQPFYGEARLDPDPSRGMVAGRFQPHPAPATGSWFGVPQTPPFALVIGSPYLGKWLSPRSGEPLGDVVLHSSTEWPTPPDGGCPRPTESIVQDPDYTIALLTPDQWPESYRQRREQMPISLGRIEPDPTTPAPFALAPERKPTFWPFSEERHPELFSARRS